MNTDLQTAESAAWWRPLQVAAGQSLECRIGPLRLLVQHTADEWRIASEYTDEIPGPVPPADLRVGMAPLPDDGVERYVAPHGDEQLRLKPLLPDRPIVNRPRQPLYLPSQSKTTLFLSTPVWLQIEVGEKLPIVLCELPVLQLSDTWFGPSTREGDLCYSDKTHARHDLDELPYRPHRAVTAVTILNEAATTLPLEKLSVPVPLLSVYGATDGSLWTQSVSLTRRSDSGMATIKIESEPPATAGELTLIGGPRNESGRGGLVRAFNLLFGS